MSDDLYKLACQEREWLMDKREELESQLAEARREITAYQTRVDNDALRLKAAYSLAGSE